MVESASDSNVFTDADHSKLNAIETNAKDDQTITAGSGLSGGGTGDVTLSHADTSSVSNSDNSGNTFIQDITFDTYGHVQSVGTGTVSVGNGTLTVQGTGALGGSGTFTANQSGNSTISISHDDTSSQGSVNNSGATVIQDVTLDTYGHITGLASKTLTLADLGGSASADSIATATSDPSGSVGKVYFNTSTNRLKIYDSSGWRNLTNLPPFSTGGTVSITGAGLSSFSYSLGIDFSDANQAASTLSFAKISGSFPSGISISSGTLSGTLGDHSSSATYTFSITATDADGLTSPAQNYSLTVSATPIHGLFDMGSTSFPSNTSSTTSGGYIFKRYDSSDTNFNLAKDTSGGKGEAYILMWGSSGGSYNTSSTYGGYGGWGLAKISSIEATSSSFRLENANNGTYGTSVQSGGSIGGGASGTGGGYNRFASGGGLTALFNGTSRTHGNVLLCVGSGGGGSSTSAQSGSHGGGYNQNGVLENNDVKNGPVGLVTGSGGQASYSSSWGSKGAAGSALTGGAGGNSSYDGGAGGGAGYYGGSGGHGGGGYSGGGGGGGSGYAISGAVIQATGTLVASASTNKSTLQNAINSAIGVSYTLPNIGGHQANGGWLIFQVT